ncbi:MAG: type II secretion system minor pseudopilin GspI [Proteobacteria bacterium]|nr:type II secretion system minor pseudopilin GspI [Pseudomonadota bacterium]
MTRTHGFTLIEVMVSLAIIGMSLLALAEVMGSMIDNSNAMREKTYASWIAQNKIAEFHLANVIPEVSATSGEIDYANTTWYWRAVIAESGVENLYRVDVTVFYPDRNTKIRAVTGFIGEPVILGQSNRSWNRGSQNPGETR